MQIVNSLRHTGCTAGSAALKVLTRRLLHLIQWLRRRNMTGNLKEWESFYAWEWTSMHT